jgi:hypothetical protein
LVSLVVPQPAGHLRKKDFPPAHFAFGPWLVRRSASIFDYGKKAASGLDWKVDDAGRLLRPPNGRLGFQRLARSWGFRNLAQVTGWSRADPRRAPHHAERALFGGWRIEDM